MVDRPPVIAAWGAGVDSTAMIVELATRGEPIDMVLFADPGAEKSATYAFIPVFRAWMSERRIASKIVSYRSGVSAWNDPNFPLTIGGDGKPPRSGFRLLRQSVRVCRAG